MPVIDYEGLERCCEDHDSFSVKQSVENHFQVKILYTKFKTKIRKYVCK